MRKQKEKKGGGLRRRWLLNIVGVVFALGLVCSLAVTALFAGNRYGALEAELRYRAESTTDFFGTYLGDQTYSEFYESCIAYAESFGSDSEIALQFLNRQGRIAASSDGSSDQLPPATPEIAEALSSRGIFTHVGRDARSGKRIMAVSGPMIYASGEVIGVVRYVVPTSVVDGKILLVGVSSLGVLLLLTALVTFSGRTYIRSVMGPLADITEKAKRIASGSYGIRIQTKYADEIGELADTISELSAKISQNEKMQTEFISSLSHELRTPLTAINGWSETLLADETMDQDTRRGLKIISREAQRLTEMVMDLLDFTRMQDGRMTLTVETTDIRAEFEDTVFMYSSRLAQDGIRLDYLDNDDEIPEIPCDPKRLRQVFLNILDNAAKHGGEAKHIEASMGFEGGQVVVRIRDYGPGIPADELPLVKKKFYKGSSKARGSGIGLAVCDEIIQMHGGTLELRNAEGGGTLVTVTLPASQ